MKLSIVILGSCFLLVILLLAGAFQPSVPASFSSQIATMQASLDEYDEELNAMQEENQRLYFQLLECGCTDSIPTPHKCSQLPEGGYECDGYCECDGLSLDCRNDHK